MQHLPRHATLLLAVALTGCAAIERTGTATRKTLGPLFGDSPHKAALAMENPRNPDARRRGINKLVEYDFGKRHPYTTRYMEIARGDEDFLVRATAIRALNRARWQPAAPVFIEALADRNVLIRLEAAKALANVADLKAMGPLVKVVNNADEDQDVRIAAADALKHYKTPEAARALVAQLSGREFGVAWQSRRSLRRLTGRDLRYDEAAWAAYLAGPDKPFG